MVRLPVGIKILSTLAASAAFAQPAIRSADAQVDLADTGAQHTADVRCADYQQQRNIYWGDLHLHTAYSQDAVSFQVSATPFDAYAQAPESLDFLAVTDHSEYLGEASLCTTPGSPGYDTQSCIDLRDGNPFILNMLCKNATPVMDPAVCASLAEQSWGQTRKAAKLHNQPCEFSAFVGYEYSLDSRLPDGDPSTRRHRPNAIETDDAQSAVRRHRNVIFRDDRVAPPVDAFSTPKLGDFWSALNNTCVAEEGCQALSIPHQLNTSRGFAFATVELSGEPISTANLLLQSKFEVLAEVFQHKGASECYPQHAAGQDQACSFELLDDAEMQNEAEEVPPGSFARFGLREGLALEQSLGFNPFRFGMTASTDSHSGYGGQTDEANWQGHTGEQDATALVRLERGRLNPGGLTGVWARQNTREEIFDALIRREVYATSGSRPLIRFFAGWEFAPTSCAGGVAANGYQGGVPMGGLLPEQSGGGTPKFLISMQRDPLSAGIDQVQIIKGWLNADGTTGESVTTVFDTPLVLGVGQGCIFWEDPEYLPGQLSVYYARMLEAPVDRWSAYDCALGGADCDAPNDIPEGYEMCCDGTLPAQVRERAWTSPIWIRP